MGELRTDFDNFHKNLRRHAFFNTEDDGTDITSTPESNKGDIFIDPEIAFKHRKFKLPSSWEPHGPPPIEAFIKTNEKDLSMCKIKTVHKQNITKGETAALLKLSKNHNLVIKAIDKGSQISVMNTSDYIKEGTRQCVLYRIRS